MATVHAAASDWSVFNGGLMFKNESFYVKGVSWFGSETCTFAPHGLHVHTINWYLDFMQQNQFNLIRLPLSEHLLLHGFDTFRPESWSTTADPSIQSLTTIQLIDQLMMEASKRGIFILFDMHRLRCEDQGHELWYSLSDSTYTADTFFEAWEKVINRYHLWPAWHGIDLLNEPRGRANWSNDTTVSWNRFVEYAFNRFDTYKGLIYVEGVGWGRDFVGVKDFPINVPHDRLVYSPHCYGPSVAPVGSMDPNLLHADWNNMFGYLALNNECVVVGETGGRYEGADKVWQDLFFDYMISLRIQGIYWCLNPDSLDSKGLLEDDWSTPNYDKLALMHRLQPHPTILTRQNFLRKNNFLKKS